MSKPGVPYWMIERYRRWQGAAEWLGVEIYTYTSGPKASLSWTGNVHRAMRFDRREDAEAFMALHPDFTVLAGPTEHIDMDRAEEER